MKSCSEEIVFLQLDSRLSVDNLEEVRRNVHYCVGYTATLVIYSYT